MIFVGESLSNPRARTPIPQLVIGVAETVRRESGRTPVTPLTMFSDTDDLADILLIDGSQSRSDEESTGARSGCGQRTPPGFFRQRPVALCQPVSFHRMRAPCVRH